MENCNKGKILDTNTSNNKRIAKNTLMLYIRMLLSMVVSLYTSRVVLNTLGVEDYGIYGVVGGVVSMFSFLNASMSGATSRFLTYEMGKGDFQKLKDTFSSALIVHISIVLIVLVLAETVGLWFLMNKLVIPEERMYAVHWVYQLSVFSMAVGVTQVPYNASIIAHEKMDVYAYVEILNVILKLLIVYVLVIGTFDKLVLYALLTLGVSVFIAFIYRIYCIKQFEECYFYWNWKPDILKPMLFFSGWDLYGNISVTVRTQGRNFLINMFFGVIFNAASTVATTVSGTVLAFTSTIVQAFRPHIIKLYANEKITEMQVAASNAIKYSLLLMSLMAVPLIIEADYVFKLWLVDVPPYAVIFCQLTLISMVSSIVNTIIGCIIHATGKIKQISLITGTLFWLQVPVIYMTFKLGLDVTYSYIIDILGTICIVCSNLLIAKYNVPKLSIRAFVKSILMSLLVIISAFIITYIIVLQREQSFLRLLLSIVGNAFVVVLLAYTFVLDRDTKLKVSQRIRYCIRFIGKI